MRSYPSHSHIINRNMMKYLIIKLKWRWLLVMVLYASLTLATYKFLNFDTAPAYLDIIFIQINEESIICFSLTYIFLIIIGDINLYNLNINNVKKLVIYIVTCAACLVALYLLVNFATYLIIAGDSINYINTIAIENKPWEMVGLSLLFVFLRIVFSSLLIILINCFSKKLLGFISVLVISLIDWMFYPLFRIKYALGILPIEHTKVFYTEALLPNINGIPRVSFFASIIYWTVLIVILLAVINQRIKVNNNDNKART